jgi:nitrite reductase/ring-hydroxylating ferredoxin subunit
MATVTTTSEPLAAPIPHGLLAPGAAAAPFRPAWPADSLPVGAMRRFTMGDLDVLIAHTPVGIVATDDRCPHMAAPLSAGALEGCEVDCPLHRGRFDLSSGEVVRFPTTGGLDADGRAHPPWQPTEGSLKPEPSDQKARARALTRVRRMRFYPVRISDGVIEVALPE